MSLDAASVTTPPALTAAWPTRQTLWQQFIVVLLNRQRFLAFVVGPMLVIALSKLPASPLWLVWFGYVIGMLIQLYGSQPAAASSTHDA